MRLLYVNYISGLWGDGVHAQEFIKAGRGAVEELIEITPHMFAPRAGISAPKRKSALRRFVSYHFFDAIAVLRGGIRKLPAELRMLLKLKPDAIITRSGQFFSIIPLARLFRVPLVLEFNAPIEELLTYDKEHRHWPWFMRTVERILLHLSSGVMVVTEALGHYVESRGVPREKICVNQNGADITKFKSTVSGQEVRKQYGLETQIVIGYTGFFKPWHRIDLMIRALTFLPQDTALLLVGDGLETESYRILARELGVESRVIITGRIPHDQMPEYVAAFDIGVIPFHQDYCSPIKMFEYMAMGKPVVAVDTPGIREIITPDVDGVLVKPEDEQVLANALKTLIEDKSLSERIAIAGKNKIVTHYSWKRNAERAVAFAKRLAQPGL